MDDLTQKIILYLVTTIIFLGVIGIGYKLLINTPAGKGLNQFLGGVGAVLGAVGSQLETCGTNGFFSKGCYLGWGGIAIFGTVILAKIGSFFINSKFFQKYRTISGKSEAEAADECGKMIGSKISPEVQAQVEEAYPENMQTAIWERVAIRAGLEMQKAAIEQSPMTPQNKLNAIKQAEQAAADQTKESDENNDLDEGDSQEAGDVSDNIWNGEPPVGAV